MVEPRGLTASGVFPKGPLLLDLKDDGVKMPNVQPKLTERQVLDLLRQRHVRRGNGGSGEYAYLEHVRNSAGFNSNRTFDAVTLSLWPSRGLHLHAYEVKCSRSDWLRELKEPAKAEAAAVLVDQFSLVIADEGIVRLGELPPTWGLLAVQGSKLVCVKDAPLLPEANPKRPIPRSFLVALLRANGAVPVAESEEVRAARREGVEQGRALEATHVEHADAALKELRERVREFELAAGVTLQSWYAGGSNPKRIGEAVRLVLEGDNYVDRVKQDIGDAHHQLVQAAKRLEPFLRGESYES